MRQRNLQNNIRKRRRSERKVGVKIEKQEEKDGEGKSRWECSIKAALPPLQERMRGWLTEGNSTHTNTHSPLQVIGVMKTSLSVHLKGEVLSYTPTRASPHLLPALHPHPSGVLGAAPSALHFLINQWFFMALNKKAWRSPKRGNLRVCW